MRPCSAQRARIARPTADSKSRGPGKIDKGNELFDGHRAKLLEYAAEGMRKHLLKCFGRAYLGVGLDFLETCADSKWTSLTAEDGVGWELDGTRVIIRKVKGR